MHDAIPSPWPRKGRHWLPWPGVLAAMAVACHGQTLYQFGDPSAEEQLYIELINRARDDPPAESLRLATTTDPAVLRGYTNIYSQPYWTVDLGLMQNEFLGIARQPPLAPNASLTIAARAHSAWMLANKLQEHNESPTNTPASRITAAGYSPAICGENIYAYASSVWFGHCGLEVDWGPPDDADGMLEGRGHRMNIHDPAPREIGVGVTLGSNGTFGPQLVTQDFATSTCNPTLATGVAYYDLNGNQFYDIGEGISGLTVNVSGTGVTQYCNTATGGGWVVPIPPTAANRTVSFSGLGMNQSVSLTVEDSKNAKADLRLTYVPPVIVSTAGAAAGLAHTLAFTTVGGASAYQWNRWSLTAAAVETCDSTDHVTLTKTGTYSVHNTTIKQEGTASFHLENTIAPGASQAIQLEALYYGKASSSLSFLSRVRNATTYEQCKVQVKEEGSLVWQDVYSQTGTNTDAEAIFRSRNAALGSMAGKAFRIRFLLSYSTGGSYYYNYSGNLVGWFIDAISFSNVDTLSNNVCQTLTGTTGSFTPAVGTYLISVAPVITGRAFAAAYQTLVASTKPLAAVTLGNLAATYSGTQKPATATTTPAGLAVALTYDGSPAAPANTGTYTVVGTISDPTYQGSAIGTLVISPRSFATWASDIEVSNHLAANSIASSQLDFDHDGRSNMLEYAFGTSPVIANASGAGMPAVRGSPTHFVLRYERDTALTDLTFSAECSADLIHWKSIGESGAPDGFSDAWISTTGTVETREASVPRSAGYGFLRMRVNRP
jgi:hypothetical protein